MNDYYNYYCLNQFNYFDIILPFQFIIIFLLEIKYSRDKFEYELLIKRAGIKSFSKDMRLLT